MRSGMYWFGLLIAVVFAGCDSATKIAGEYSYKASGTVAIDGAAFALGDEQGTLDLLRKTDERMLLMFSPFRGGVYTAGAMVGDTVLTLYPFSRTVKVSFTDTVLVGGIESVRKKEEVFDVEVTGKGMLYKEAIVFDLYYHGASQSSDALLKGENILLVAKKN